MCFNLCKYKRLKLTISHQIIPRNLRAPRSKPLICGVELWICGALVRGARDVEWRGGERGASRRVAASMGARDQGLHCSGSAVQWQISSLHPARTLCRSSAPCSVWRRSVRRASRRVSDRAGETHESRSQRERGEGGGRWRRRRAMQKMPAGAPTDQQGRRGGRGGGGWCALPGFSSPTRTRTTWCTPCPPQLPECLSQSLTEKSLR